MLQIVIGAGEVGESIGRTLQDLGHQVFWFDLKMPEGLPMAEEGEEADALHICIPYSSEFVEQVKHYFAKFPTSAVIVHSTVRPGTCDQLEDVLVEEATALERLPVGVVFSPVRGSHRSNGGLRPAIRRLVKYYAVAHEPSFEAEFQFLQAFRGLTLKAFPDVRSLEFAKVMSTTYLGWVIAFEKRMHLACREYNFDFDSAYTEWNRTYNDGMPEKFCRPVLDHMEGPIGGHCVLPNLDLLEGIYPVESMRSEIGLWKKVTSSG